MSILIDFLIAFGITFIPGVFLVFLLPTPYKAAVHFLLLVAVFIFLRWRRWKAHGRHLGT